MKFSAKLRAGDLVEVKYPNEILQTLDSDGTLNDLPFMPEMVEFCGRRFRVLQRVLKTCCYVTHSNMRKFKSDDVVLLEGLRCTGAAHDECQRACTIFWREAWLRKVNKEDADALSALTKNNVAILSHLKTLVSTGSYFCQASELLKATSPLPRKERILRCFSDVHCGNCTSFEMAHRIGIWLFGKIRRGLANTPGTSKRKLIPTEVLGLACGDLIEIKPMTDITGTLNKTGCNRGLRFMPGMNGLCRQERRVERKIDKMIMDGTGEMRRIRDTVFLEGSLCSCSHVAFGGCPRGEFAYWREAWLKRPA